MAGGLWTPDRLPMNNVLGLCSGERRSHCLVPCVLCGIAPSLQSPRAGGSGEARRSLNPSWVGFSLDASTHLIAFL